MCRDFVSSATPFFILIELGLFSPEKRRLQADLTVAFQYIKGAYKKDGDRLFAKACSDRRESSGALQGW